MLLLQGQDMKRDTIHGASANFMYLFWHLTEKNRGSWDINHQEAACNKVGALFGSTDIVAAVFASSWYVSKGECYKYEIHTVFMFSYVFN